MCDKKERPTFEFHFHDKVGQNNANVEHMDVRFDKDMNVQVQNVEEMADASAPSPVHLSTARGTKIDLIRVVNCLYELGFFTDDKGGKIAKKEVMTVIGQAVGVDLSTYDNDLSRSLSDSTKLEKHLAIFDRLKTKMEEVFDGYGG